MAVDPAAIVTVVETVSAAAPVAAPPVAAPPAAAPPVKDWSPVIGLIGVAVGGLLQLIGSALGVWFQAHLASKARSDVREDRDQQAARALGFPSIAVAQHLETYAQLCAGLIRNISSVDIWVGSLPDWTPYPDLNWFDFGAVNEALARDFVSRTGLQITRFSQLQAGPETTAALKLAASTVGLEAWGLAERFRREAGLPPFTFSETGWNYVEVLQSAQPLTPSATEAV